MPSAAGLEGEHTHKIYFGSRLYCISCEADAMGNQVVCCNQSDPGPEMKLDPVVGVTSAEAEAKGFAETFEPAAVEPSKAGLRDERIAERPNHSNL